MNNSSTSINLISTCDSGFGAYVPDNTVFDESDIDIIEDIEVKCIKKAKVVKTEEDMIPLPDPFPLPKHFKQDVEVALRERKMSTGTRQRFISDVAATMFGYKKYPSKDDYSNVARSIVNSYPCIS